MYHDTLKNMCNISIRRITDSPIMEILNPTNGHGGLTDGDSTMLPIGFD